MANPKEVPCPQCGAKPGEKCFTRLDITHIKQHISAFHAARTASTARRKPSYS